MNTTATPVREPLTKIALRLAQRLEQMGIDPFGPRVGRIQRKTPMGAYYVEVIVDDQVLAVTTISGFGPDGEEGSILWLNHPLNPTEAILDGLGVPDLSLKGINKFKGRWEGGS